MKLVIFPVVRCRLAVEDEFFTWLARFRTLRTRYWAAESPDWTHGQLPRRPYSDIRHRRNPESPWPFPPKDSKPLFWINYNILSQIIYLIDHIIDKFKSKSFYKYKIHWIQDQNPSNQSIKLSKTHCLFGNWNFSS